MKSRILFLLIALASTQCLAQQVNSILPLDPTRSGLVTIRGNDLLGQSLRIAGQNVHVARWTSSLIELYVAESTPLGQGALVLVKNGQPFTLGTLNVRARSPLPGRLRWRFQAADQFITSRPAVGQDGTVYALGNYGHLYALTPAGALKWVWSGGVAGTVDVCPDGTIVCGGGGGVQAFSPSGVRLWNFAFSTPLLCGPNVGPDGNVYAVDNLRWGTNILGAMVLSPSGQLLWNGGNYYGRGADFTPAEIVFDNENAYFDSGGSSSVATPGLSAVRLGGGARWVNPDGVGRQPAGFANGGVGLVGTSTVEKWSAAGVRIWSRSLWDFGGFQTKGDLVSLSDGSLYTLLSNNRILGFEPNGATRLNAIVPEMPSQLAARPDSNALVLQTTVNFGQPSRLRAYSPSGALLWISEDLPIELGTVISIFNRIGFSDDSAVAYFGTSGPMTGADTAYSYVYAADAIDRSLPTSFMLLTGLQRGGNLAALQSSDDVRLALEPGSVDTTEPPVQLVVEGTATTATPAELRFRLESRMNVPDIRQTIELWDFVAQRYVLLDTRPTPLLDAEVELVAPNPARFVQPGTRKLRSRIAWVETSTLVETAWRAEVDRAMWLMR